MMCSEEHYLDPNLCKIHSGLVAWHHLCYKHVVFCASLPKDCAVDDEMSVIIGVKCWPLL